MDNISLVLFSAILALCGSHECHNNFLMFKRSGKAVFSEIIKAAELFSEANIGLYMYNDEDAAHRPDGMSAIILNLTMKI